MRRQADFRMRTLAVRSTRFVRGQQSRRGAALVLIAILMLCFMVTLTLSVDVAMMHLARTQLRTSTDAAAKAAVVAFADTGRPQRAIQRGRELARDNQIFNKTAMLNQNDFSFGRSLPRGSGKFEFEPDERPFNTIRVTGTRSVPPLFGQTLGLNPFETQIEATATLVRRDIALMMDGNVDYAAQIAATRAFANAMRRSPTPVKLGLGTYTDVGTIEQGLTNNLGLMLNALLQLINAILGGLFPPPGGFDADLSVGLQTGKQILDANVIRIDTERSIVLISTAREIVRRDPRIRARALAAEGIVIHTVAYGADADAATMRDIAQIGRGLHFHALNLGQLIAASREIARSLKHISTE